MSDNRRDPFAKNSPFGKSETQKTKNPSSSASFPGAPVTPAPATQPEPVAPTLPGVENQPASSGTFPVPENFNKPEFRTAQAQKSLLFPERPVQENLPEEYEEENYEQEQPVNLLEDYSDDEIYLAERQIDSSTYPSAIPTLYALAEDTSWIVRANVAANLATPVPLLERLAKDKDSKVRETVMTNPNCPDHVYRAFAFDADDDVIFDWVEQARTTLEMLTPLFNTNNVFVASALLDSPLVPASTKSNLRQKHRL